LAQSPYMTGPDAGSNKTKRMHADERDIDGPMVRRLLAAQFPRYADLPLAAVPSAGTDNAVFRLGQDLAVRLPRIHWAVDDARKEHKFLPELAPYLPLQIPEPLEKGVPGEGYPWPWSIYRWLEGEDATLARIADRRQLAEDLARFVVALHQIDTVELLPTGDLSSNRGGPLSARDAATRAAIGELNGMIDVALVTAAWEAALRTPSAQSRPVWIHGDLKPGNLLATNGRLTGVIDWGGLALGDPAVDLIVAWNFLPAEAREVFRRQVSVDDATWARGRGWALSIGLVALPYYKDSNPELAHISRYQIREVLADYRQAG
jgi:aminoglycoside phosphotransferase (APT) family kinase protein